LLEILKRGVSRISALEGEVDEGWRTWLSCPSPDHGNLGQFCQQVSKPVLFETGPLFGAIQVPA
jgi:hypothetical protein